MSLRSWMRRPRLWLTRLDRLQPVGHPGRAWRAGTSMNLPISNSDASPEWTRCLAACVGTLALGALLLLAFMIAVDPYDSGKFGLLGIDGVNDRDSHTATASRARDANFDSGHHSAIRRAAARSGRAVESDRPALCPALSRRRRSSRAVAALDFFLRHHPDVGALVVAADPSWCAHDRAAPGRPSHTGSTGKVRFAMPPG